MWSIPVNLALERERQADSEFEAEFQTPLSYIMKPYLHPYHPLKILESLLRTRSLKLTVMMIVILNKLNI